MSERTINVRPTRICFEFKNLFFVFEVLRVVRIGMGVALVLRAFRIRAEESQGPGGGKKSWER